MCRTGNPSEYGSPGESSKRSKESRRSQTLKVEIRYAAEIPVRDAFCALQGVESEKGQDALRVLDIILRQHAAGRCA